MNVSFTYNKTIIDKKGCPKVYYDGGSMGGGYIKFSCGSCGKDISQETFYFWKDNLDHECSIINKLEKHLDLPGLNQRNHTFVGLLSCQTCGAKHVLHIDYGEVSNCHWQSSLHKVVLCNS